MERAITASEANQKFSEMLRAVARGESFIVTSRGRPVARVAPIVSEPDPMAIRAMLKAFEDRPMVSGGRWKREDLYD